MELMPFQKKTGIMIDCETLSSERNAVVVSIGAVKFDFCGSIITDEFYVNIEPLSCKKLGCHIDPATIDWWKSQPKEVREAWQKDPIPVEDALARLTQWWDKKSLFYCQGLSFDSPIIANLYHKLGQKEPWHYHDEMDARTIFTMIGHENWKARNGSNGHHNALDDAKAQATKLMEFFGYEAF